MAKVKKQVIGTISFEEALAHFAEKSVENRQLIDLVKKTNALIDQIILERNVQDLSQRDLARIADVKQPMIARFERAETMPRLDTFIKIAQCLNLDLKLEHVERFSSIEYEDFDKVKYSYNETGEEENYGVGKENQYQTQLYCQRTLF